MKLNFHFLKLSIIIACFVFANIYGINATAGIFGSPCKPEHRLDRNGKCRKVLKYTKFHLNYGEN